ncbi:hypothetical protein BR10RB9215_C12141 [Brucella sp. 10RB9215]|uniref:hypothetical protein n=1 Tax=Brucella sp. 10RB9215 TaxID=1149953 RepID=UPI000909541C|nr:hypothetical protein [Brucella sp. 10RB9215]SBW15290.1 hypothetical protein BR10RB9215_C12141 [Brucella sp. 10RB9215]
MRLVLAEYGFDDREQSINALIASAMASLNHRAIRAEQRLVSVDYIMNALVDKLEGSNRELTHKAA